MIQRLKRHRNVFNYNAFNYNAFNYYFNRYLEKLAFDHRAIFHINQ